MAGAIAPMEEDLHHFAAAYHLDVVAVTVGPLLIAILVVVHSMLMGMSCFLALMFLIGSKNSYCSLAIILLFSNNIDLPHSFTFIKQMFCNNSYETLMVGGFSVSPTVPSSSLTQPILFYYRPIITTK